MLFWQLLCSSIAFIVVASVYTVSAFVLPSVRSSQHRSLPLQSSMYRHVFKLRGRLLLSISSRAVLAASAGSYALPSQPDHREPGGAERWASSGRQKLGSGWLHASSQPALAMAASRSTGARSFSAIPLKFRGGATATEGQWVSNSAGLIVPTSGIVPVKSLSTADTSLLPLQ